LTREIFLLISLSPKLTELLQEGSRAKAASVAPSIQAENGAAATGDLIERIRAERGDKLADLPVLEQAKHSERMTNR
jgi:hypothetical protein